MITKMIYDKVKAKREAKALGKITEDDMDRYVRVMLPRQVDSAKTFNSKDYENMPIPQPSWDAKPLKKKKILDGLLELPENDEDFDTGSFTVNMKKMMLGMISKAELLFPVVDIDNEVKNDEVAAEWRTKTCEDTIPTPVVEWKDMHSDDAISKLAFGAMPVGYTKLFDAKNNNIPSTIEVPKELLEKIVYQNDFSTYNKYKTREAFFDFGAICLFDAEYKLLAIYVCDGDALRVAGKASEQDWDNAKRIWLSTFFSIYTIKEHLMETHVTESSNLAVAVSENLGKHHPLRRFLKPFTYRTHFINYMATVALLPKGGMVDRAFPLEYPSLAALVSDSVDNYKFVPYLERFDKEVAAKVNDDKVFPIASDFPLFYQIMFDYTKGYLDAYYADIEAIKKDKELMGFWSQLLKLLKIKIGAGDEEEKDGEAMSNDYNLKMDSKEDLVKLVTDLICVVTSVHGWYGGVSEYLWLPSLLNARAWKNGTKMSLQSWASILIIVIATGFRMPGLNPAKWTHLILDDDNKEALTKLYQETEQKLEQLEKEIEVKNKERRVPLRYCCSSVLGCSVNI